MFSRAEATNPDKPPALVAAILFAFSSKSGGSVTVTRTDFSSIGFFGLPLRGICGSIAQFQYELKFIDQEPFSIHTEKVS